MTAQDVIAANDVRDIVTLRLLVARAANSDSMAWWDDESLASHSGFLLRRIFPIAPATAARSLALQAANARHKAAIDEADALHLFRLDLENRDALATRRFDLGDVEMPQESLTKADLRQHLEIVTGGPKPYKVIRRTPGNGLLIEVPDTQSVNVLWQHRASTLAWAYLEGEVGQPVFPYLLEDSIDGPSF